MDITTPGRITTEDQARKWFRALFEAGINFHPDDGFDDIVDHVDGSKQTFTSNEVDRMNAALDDVFALNQDPCGLALEVMAVIEAERITEERAL